MRNEDDQLDPRDELDMSAWQVPPPPEDLADVVIDRMGGTDVAVTVPIDPRDPRRRWLWLTAGVLAAMVVCVAGLYALVRSSHRAAPGSGTVIAGRARALSLDGITAMVDASVDLSWQRKGDGLHVQQRGGVAVWRVDADEKLMIDAGAMGVSVEATGASLRVEVGMNSMDARVIGASAVTAAAVALITVVVYEGQVKVREQAQTVVVQPGSRWESSTPRSPEILVGGAKPSPVDPALAPAGSAVGEVAGSPPPTNVPPTLLEGSRIAGEKMISPDDVIKTEIQRSGKDRIVGSFKLCLTVDGNISNVTMLKSTGFLAYDNKIQGEMRSEWRYKPYMVNGKAVPVCTAVTFIYSPADSVEHCDEVSCVLNNYEGTCCAKFRKGAGKPGEPAVKTVPRANCDAQALRDKGMDQVSLGQHAAALVQFEASLRCEKDPYVLQLVFMEACNAGNSPKAKHYFKLLNADQQTKFAQICDRQKPPVEYQ